MINKIFLIKLKLNNQVIIKIVYINLIVKMYYNTRLHVILFQKKVNIKVIVLKILINQKIKINPHSSCNKFNKIIYKK